jgi:hypothetical protein
MAASLDLGLIGNCAISAPMGIINDAVRLSAARETQA